MGVIKSQLSPFNWKTVLVLVLAVGSLFFAFRLFGKFNTAPDAVVEQVQQVAQQMEVPSLYEQPQQPQQQQQPLEQQQPEEGAQYEQDAGPAAANE